MHRESSGSVRHYGLAQYIVLASVISIPLSAYILYEQVGSDSLMSSLMSEDETGIRFRALLLFVPLILLAIAYIVNQREKHLEHVVLSEIQLRDKNEELTAFNERLTALRSIDMAISTSIDLNATIKVLIDNVMSQLKVDAVKLMLYAPDTRELMYSAGKGLNTSKLESERIKLGQGFAGRSVESRQKLCIEDMDTYISGASPDVAAAVRGSVIYADEGARAYFCYPLVSHDRVLGVIEALNRAPISPEPEWYHFFETFAAQAAIAIEKASLFSDLRDTNIELVNAYDLTIEGWAKALDYRDKETEGHSRRVTELTVIMAEAMGIKGEDILHVKRGALLHDIGKIGVPDNILLKPGKLDPAERAIMERHPDISYNLLNPITFLKPIIDIPYCHHERWDGTGYPRRLKGKDIPLAARIFSVIDVWDALRSDRPYRKSWSYEKTVEHIKAGAGSHFDPEVIEIFMKHIPRYGNQYST